MNDEDAEMDEAADRAADYLTALVTHARMTYARTPAQQAGLHAALAAAVAASAVHLGVTREEHLEATAALFDEASHCDAEEELCTAPGPEGRAS